MSGILNALIGSYAPAGGSFESIATLTGNGSASTLTFSSIPSTYQHLQLRLLGKSTTTSFAMSQLQIRFNSDSGNNYSYHRLQGDGASASASGAASTTSVILDGMMIGSTTGLTNMMSVAIVDIHDYASTTKNKTVRSFSGADRNGNSTSDPAIALNSAAWLSTSAINSISIIGNPGPFTTSTVFALYGIKGA